MFAKTFFRRGSGRAADRRMEEAAHGRGLDEDGFRDEDTKAAREVARIERRLGSESFDREADLWVDRRV